MTQESTNSSQESIQKLAKRLDTYSLRHTARGDTISRIMSAALVAVDPATAVQSAMRKRGNHMIVGERTYDLSQYHRIFMIGAGKAGVPMASAVTSILGDRVENGLIIVKEGYTQGDVPTNLEIVEAAHPVPDQRGVDAARRLQSLITEATEHDLVICLISGGGSALLASPSPGLTLNEIQSLTNTLLACGADIGEINSLRKHLEILKGGWLAKFAAPASLVTVVLSDVVGNLLDVIASGPTVPDPTTYEDAYQVLIRYEILDRVPKQILKHLQEGMHKRIPETPKPGNPVFDNSYNLVIGSNQTAARAALSQAQQEGLNTLLLTTYLQGEARYIGRTLGAIAQQIVLSGEPIASPACIVAGGETTVTLTGNGLGGRNQEVALGSVRDLGGLSNIVLATLATDGGDGPTDAAGAVVTGETLHRALNLGLSPEDYLSRNDSYRFFEKLDDLFKPGATLTNVNDLNFIFAF
jgi:glycerate 2-kinase